MGRGNVKNLENNFKSFYPLCFTSSLEHISSASESVALGMNPEETRGSRNGQLSVLVVLSRGCTDYFQKLAFLSYSIMHLEGKTPIWVRAWCQ